jgi:predicted enzyme related to lactoylglutathione lyase
MAKRKVVWLEIFTDDRTKTAKFYADLFGFEIQDFPDMNYTTLSTGNEETGIGIGQRTADNPGATTIYIESSNLEADLKAIEAKGGQVVIPPMEVPNVGRMAFFTDPGGNMMALGDFIQM